MSRVGSFVLYMLRANDAIEINRRIRDAAQSMGRHREDADGSVVHVGNVATEGDQLPMLIVRDWGGSVNGQVFLDGNHTLWKTSVSQGDGPGHWI